MSCAPRASAIALAMHAGVDMQLPSASPFAPKGVWRRESTTSAESVARMLKHSATRLVASPLVGEAGERSEPGGG